MMTVILIKAVMLMHRLSTLFIFYIYYYCSFFLIFDTLFTLIAMSSVHFHSRPRDIFSGVPQSSGTVSYFMQALLNFSLSCAYIYL